MEYPGHTSTLFDGELMSAYASVTKMAATVARQLNTAMGALNDGNPAPLQQVFDDGDLVDSMEVSLDEQCTEILVRRQPTANDLRLVSAIIKTINDLERIGDESENIARAVQLVAQKQPYQLPCRSQINFVAQIAIGMLKAAMESFDAMDAASARKVGHRDALIDEEFNAIMRHLVAYMMEETSDLATTLQIVFITRTLENISNHARNISEYVIYLVEGREARNYCTI